jgi:hypothetical protein
MREKSNFVSAFKPILAVQLSEQKYFASVFPKSVVSSCHPASMKRGVRAIVTTREAGMRWTRSCLKTNGNDADVKSCGPGAPTLALSS